MMQRFILTGVALSALLLTHCVTAADPQAKETKAEQNKLLGTWKMISAKYNGTESDTPKTFICLKHITPTYWVWTHIDPKTKQVTMMAGGTYTLTDDSYVEIPRHGMGQAIEEILDKPQKFTWKIEGNKWYHVGELSNGTKLEEVWERETGATAEK